MYLSKKHNAIFEHTMAEAAYEERYCAFVDIPGF
jgi:hypothetical protein